MITFRDRSELFRIHDSEDGDLFVVADSFEEAIERYRHWNSREDPDQEIEIESVANVGYLIKHDYTEPE